jgi:hypothetical protein
LSWNIGKEQEEGNGMIDEEEYSIRYNNSNLTSHQHETQEQNINT